MNLLNGECKNGLWRLAKRKRQKQTKHEEMCFVNVLVWHVAVLLTQRN